MKSGGKYTEDTYELFYQLQLKGKHSSENGKFHVLDFPNSSSRERRNRLSTRAAGYNLRESLLHQTAIFGFRQGFFSVKGLHLFSFYPIILICIVVKLTVVQDC